MTTYHRGRVRSVYRKRAFGGLISIAGAETTISKSLIHAPPDNGLIKIKSVRFTGILPSGSSNNVLTGWVGFGRGDANATFSIEQSDVFGVQSWAIGPNNDQLISLELKGITLAVNEFWYVVGARTSGVNTTQNLIFNILYAVEETLA